jgi:hypothetical protein
MPFEYPTQRGVLRLVRTRSGWVLEFNGCRSDDWASADDAAQAAFGHRSGLVCWGGSCLDVSNELLDWRPVGENL